MFRNVVINHYHYNWNAVMDMSLTATMLGHPNGDSAMSFTQYRQY